MHSIVRLPDHAKDRQSHPVVLQLGRLLTPCQHPGASAAQDRNTLDIAEAFAVGELREGQRKERISAGEFFGVTIALVAVDANLELLGREKVDELRENGLTKIRAQPPEQAMKQ